MKTADTRTAALAWCASHAHQVKCGAWELLGCLSVGMWYGPTDNVRRKCGVRVRLMQPASH
jgi:hypothetical protein